MREGASATLNEGAARDRLGRDTLTGSVAPLSVKADAGTDAEHVP